MVPTERYASQRIAKILNKNSPGCKNMSVLFRFLKGGYVCFFADGLIVVLFYFHYILLERLSYIDDNNQRWLQCKFCCEYQRVDEPTSYITCSSCVTKIDMIQYPESFQTKQYKSTGRPPGWHWMSEFVDKDGNVFHKGVEAKQLKGTLPPTKVVSKPKKKVKRRSQEQILLDRHNEKKAALKKAVQKQKDFLNHNIDKG